jgi:hypothetical protein
MVTSLMKVARSQASSVGVIEGITVFVGVLEGGAGVVAITGGAGVVGGISVVVSETCVNCADTVRAAEVANISGVACPPGKLHPERPIPRRTTKANIKVDFRCIVVIGSPPNRASAILNEPLSDD